MEERRGGEREGGREGGKKEQSPEGRREGRRIEGRREGEGGRGGRERTELKAYLHAMCMYSHCGVTL